MGALVTAPSLDRFLNASQAFTISGGALAFNLPASPAWAVDASATPVLYTTSGGATSSVFANFIGTAGVGGAAWALPGVPGAITDLVLDKSGILYVASGGQVSALITDSPGLATGLSWPIRSHDACRSSNLEYACPY
jgi:hypothetical protein